MLRFISRLITIVIVRVFLNIQINLGYNIETKQYLDYYSTIKGN